MSESLSNLYMINQAMAGALRRKCLAGVPIQQVQPAAAASARRAGGRVGLPIPRRGDPRRALLPRGGVLELDGFEPIYRCCRAGHAEEGTGGPLAAHGDGAPVPGPAIHIW